MGAADAAVFTYGSLMIPRVMEAVCGHTFEAVDALLRGYARYTLRGETYPGLVPEAGVATDGVLWQGVDADSLRRLDVFEGDWYTRESVTVWTDLTPGAEGQACEAQTYVLVPAQHFRVSRRRWSRDRFETRYLQRFLSTYVMDTP